MYSKANYNFQTKLNYWNRSIQSVCPYMHTHNKPGELGRAECRRWWWSSSWVACWTHDALVSDIHDNRSPWRAAKTHVGVRWASRLPNAEKGSPEPLNAQMNRFNWSAPPCIYDARHQRLELDQFGFGVGKKLGRDTRHNFMRTSCCPFVLVSIFPNVRLCTEKRMQLWSCQCGGNIFKWHILSKVLANTFRRKWDQESTIVHQCYFGGPQNGEPRTS